MDLLVIHEVQQSLKLHCCLTGDGVQLLPCQLTSTRPFKSGCTTTSSVKVSCCQGGSAIVYDQDTAPPTAPKAKTLLKLACWATAAAVQQELLLCRKHKTNSATQILLHIDHAYEAASNYRC
jgi:hypothetical protein